MAAAPNTRTYQAEHTRSCMTAAGGNPDFLGHRMCNQTSGAKISLWGHSQSLIRNPR